MPSSLSVLPTSAGTVDVRKPVVESILPITPRASLLWKPLPALRKTSVRSQGPKIGGAVWPCHAASGTRQHHRHGTRQQCAPISEGAQRQVGQILVKTRPVPDTGYPGRREIPGLGEVRSLEVVNSLDQLRNQVVPWEAASEVPIALS